MGGGEEECIEDVISEGFLDEMTLNLDLIELEEASL